MVSNILCRNTNSKAQQCRKYLSIRRGTVTGQQTAARSLGESPFKLSRSPWPERGAGCSTMEGQEGGEATNLLGCRGEADLQPLAAQQKEVLTPRMAKGQTAGKQPRQQDHRKLEWWLSENTAARSCQWRPLEQSTTCLKYSLRNTNSRHTESASPTLKVRRRDRTRGGRV